MDMNNTPEPRMPPVENLEFLDLMGVISSPCTIPRGHIAPSAITRRPRDCTNGSCLVRPKGPLLRPDLLSPATAAAGRGKDRRRRPAAAGAQRPCGGLTLPSHSLKEGHLFDRLNNLPGNDS
jgi:hypothetical protein